ncbi:MAG: DUF58 domain-containing protein [Planctomycetia bacterium]|nr:DUF58 domain-containing protein [Planctomycetia bacterium]
MKLPFHIQKDQSTPKNALELHDAIPKTLKLFVLKRQDKRSSGRVKPKLVQDGLIVMAVGLLLLFNAAARGVNLLLALGAMFLGYLFFDRILGVFSISNLRVSRRLPDSIYANEPFYVEIEADGSESRSPSWCIVVEDVWEEELPIFKAPELLQTSQSSQNSEVSSKESNVANKSVKRSWKKHDKSKKKTSGKVEESAQHQGAETLRPVVYFPCVRANERVREYYIGVATRRGLRRLSALSLSTRFPCGFFRKMRQFEAKSEILVFPRIGQLTSSWDAYVGAQTEETSVAMSRTARAPDETVAIRDWRIGDSKRMIAWRATAKYGRLQSRDFAQRQTRALVFILDLYLDPTSNLSSSRRWDLAEQAVSFLATVVTRRQQDDSRVFFAMNADTVARKTKDVDNEGDNDAVELLPPSAEWNELTIGGADSARRIMTRLALATTCATDRLGQFVSEAESLDVSDLQVFVVSLAPVDRSRLRIHKGGVVQSSGSSLQSLRFLDVSSHEFQTLFQTD